MLNLALSTEEKEVLTDLLQNSMPALDVEIHRTDNLEVQRKSHQAPPDVKRVAGEDLGARPHARFAGDNILNPHCEIGIRWRPRRKLSRDFQP